LTGFKTTLFMLLVPGILMVALPISLFQTSTALFSFDVFRWLAVPFWVAGASIAIWCAWAFTVRGRGTPSPTDPPRELVTSGLYRYLRNPIYAGAMIFLLGHVLWHPSRAILAMPILVAVSAHLFILFYEEPHLRKTFGAAYEEYCRQVPRWIPQGKRID